MNKKDDLTLVPKYRFPEFKDGEGWEVKELGESLDYLQPTPYLVQTENYDNKYTIPVLTAGKSFILGYTNEQEGIFNNKLPVIIFDDFTTDSKFVDFPFKVKSSAIKILLAKYNFNIKFIFEIMQMVSYEVSVHKRHWISIFSKLKVLIPQSKEQQKIADCLSSIDDLISAEEKKLALLNDYKKGWMQKLFPAEGKTVPEWRFSEFSESWEVKSFKKYIKLYRGSSPRPIQDFITKNNGINWIKISDASDTNNFCITNVAEQITEEGAKKSRLVEKGELILANSMSFGATYEVGISGCIYDGWFVLREYENNFIKKFLLQQLNSYEQQKQYSSLSAGGVVKNISSDIVYETILKRPSIKEQEKIANFLSGIDDLISKQKDKIEVLKQHKKALMQGLFPTIEDML